MVQTVRKLNWEVRPKIASDPESNKAGHPLHQAIADIRNNEIRTSQLIRGMSLAEVGVEEDVGQVVEHVEADTVGARQLLSEFGTAREAILSILRTLPENEWEEAHDTFRGDKSFQDIVDDLIASDREHVAKIEAAIG
ncbi:MAG: hypothetical protein R2849_22955 [Thermomicrobiales bacterium]